MSEPIIDKYQYLTNVLDADEFYSLEDFSPFKMANQDIATHKINKLGREQNLDLNLYDAFFVPK